MTLSEAKSMSLQIMANAPKPAQDKKMPSFEDFLTEDEIIALVINFAHTRGDLGITEDETAELLTEAAAVRARSATLDLTIKGILQVNVDMAQEPDSRVIYRAAPGALSNLEPENHGAQTQRHAG